MLSTFPDPISNYLAQVRTRKKFLLSKKMERLTLENLLSFRCLSGARRCYKPSG